jgi:hypothetical protein
VAAAQNAIALSPCGRGQRGCFIEIALSKYRGFRLVDAGTSFREHRDVNSYQ